MSEDKTGLSIMKRAERDERNRVREMLARDRAESEREEARRLANQQVAMGNFANIQDTVATPTQEWLRKGDVENFTPKSPDNTSRSVTSVRRVSQEVVIGLWNKGKLELREAAACIRYRDDYEASNLGGRYSSSKLDLNCHIRTPMGANTPPTSHRQVQANDRVHEAGKVIGSNMLSFFNGIVVQDLKLREAARMIRCRNGQELTIFVSLASALADHYESCGVDLVFKTGIFDD